MAKENRKTVGDWSWNSELLWSKIVKLDDDQCWSWMGAVGPQTNLFGVKKNGRAQMTQTQRILYRDITGLDCEDLMIKHSCHNAYCLNPNHFVLGVNQRKFRSDGTDINTPKILPEKDQAEYKRRLVPVKVAKRWWQL